MSAAQSGFAHAGGNLTIDLGALRANYRHLLEEAAPARVAAVVKADAYGLGTDRVVPVLAEEGCRDFFVAHLDEALAITAFCPPDARLFVLNGLAPGAEPVAAAAGIIPVLNGLEQARRWALAAEALGAPLAAAVQIDTGMSRLGLSPEDAALLARDPAFSRHVSVRLVMSHLACGDEASHPANRDQSRRFDALAALFPMAERSLANSGGSFLGPAFRHDLVRPGIALYGAAPFADRPNPMRPVVRLDARVIQVRTVPPGAGVGYGLTFHANERSRIATVSVGYADGWPRSLSNRGSMFFNGRRLPIAGRVSMDSITLNVSALPDDAIAADDWVELIGPHQTIDEVAADAGTIAYEVLTSLGKRYRRTYLDNRPDKSTEQA